MELLRFPNKSVVQYKNTGSYAPKRPLGALEEGGVELVIPIFFKLFFFKFEKNPL